MHVICVSLAVLKQTPLVMVFTIVFCQVEMSQHANCLAPIKKNSWRISLVLKDTIMHEQLGFELKISDLLILNPIRSLSYVTASFFN